MPGPVDITPSLLISPQAAISNSPIGSVSLGNSLGKAVAGVHGELATTTGAAEQTIATYTVTSGKTFYLLAADVSAYLTTIAATMTIFGWAYLRVAGTEIWRAKLAGPGLERMAPVTFSEPLPIAAGVIIKWSCTPNATTPFTWTGNITGYEK